MAGGRATTAGIGGALETSRCGGEPIITPEAPADTASPPPPTWKLYENPFYDARPQSPHRRHHQWRGCCNHTTKPIHQLRLPLSARKAAASFWDLPFLKPGAAPDALQIARGQIVELKAAVEVERRIRMQTEVLKDRLERELWEARRGREAAKKVCDELARETSSRENEIDRLTNEIDIMRKASREERVQIKASANPCFAIESMTSAFSPQKQPAAFPRKPSHEAENPHIKRGIKGFVEFPRVVRAIGSRSGRWGTRLECQKAQLRVLMKPRCLVRSNNLIIMT